MIQAIFSAFLELCKGRYLARARIGDVGTTRRISDTPDVVFVVPEWFYRYYGRIFVHGRTFFNVPLWKYGGGWGAIPFMGKPMMWDPMMPDDCFDIVPVHDRGGPGAV